MNLKKSGSDTKFLVSNYMLETSTGLYWVSIEAHKAVTNLQPVISKIDTKSKTITSGLVLGKIDGKSRYFIDHSFPVLNVSKTEQVYFGSDIKKKNIWFCRVKL